MPGSDHAPLRSVLPEHRGPLSFATFTALRAYDVDAVPVEVPPVDDPVADEDLQVTLWACYELHYRGFDDVADGWEWEPRLLTLRAQLEERFLTGLRAAVGGPDTGRVTRLDVTAGLRELADGGGGRSLSRHLQREADADQFAEFVAHRSVYQLKEADPHTWAIPRLAGRAKAALIEIQLDEYGQGNPRRMHSALFARSLRALGLSADYAFYLDAVPGVTLALSNAMSLFGLHRAWRGALVGQLALYEMTSSAPCMRYAQGLRRLGGSDEACAFYDEHVTADALHEQLALHDLCGSLAEDEPGLAAQILFGARVNAHLEERFADHLLDSWEAGRTSLLTRSLIRGTRFAATA